MPEQRAAVRAAGFRGWSFDAATAERAIKRLIEDHRTTPEFIEDMLRLRRKAGQQLDDAQAFERERERAFRQAERELRQFERNLGKITDERRIARLEANLEELERAVETARQGWLLARAQTQQTSEITNDIRERINFTKQVMAVWDTASAEDQRTVVDWWVDAILVKPGRKERKRQKGEETVLVVALRSNPEKPKAVRIVQAVEGRAATPTPMYHNARSSRTRRLIQHFRVAVR